MSGVALNVQMKTYSYIFAQTFQKGKGAFRRSAVQSEGKGEGTHKGCPYGWMRLGSYGWRCLFWNQRSRPKAANMPTRRGKKL